MSAKFALRLCLTGAVSGLVLATAQIPVLAQTMSKPAPDSSGPQMAVPAGPPGREGGAADRGVAHPPAGIDPGIHVPAPQSGTMPVIPPPGTPGGNPNVIPK
jgi:hypothetical protein